MIEELCVLYLNEHEIYVQPFFNPVIVEEPKITDLYVFIGVDETGKCLFDQAPPWLLDLANDQLYDDIMGQYEETTIDEFDEGVGV